MNLASLQNYNEWKKCITISCGIPLTKDFVNTRLTELTDEKNPKTLEFKKIYGESFTQMIISHFQQAQSELN